MSFDLKGEMTIGVLCPAAEAAIVPLGAQITAELAGCVQLTAGITTAPPNVAAALRQIEALLAAVEAMISGGLDFPPPTFQLAGVAALTASLSASAGLLAALGGLFASGGVKVYVYEGRANGFAPALAGSFPGTAEEFSIVLSAGADAGVRATLLAFFGGAA